MTFNVNVNGNNSNNISLHNHESKNKRNINNNARKYDKEVTLGADTVSSVAAMGAFFKLKQLIQVNVAKYYTLGDKNLIKGVLSYFEKHKNLIKKIDKKSTAVAVAAGAAALVGGTVKNTIMGIYNSATKKFKLDKEETKNMTKAELKKAKKEVKKEKRNERLRNFGSGMINGLTTPIVGALGVIGAPIYAGVNALNRYFVGSKEEDNKPKNLTSFVDSIKNSKIATGIASAGVLLPAIFEGRANKVFDANLTKTIDKLKKTTLTKMNESKSTYEQLEDILFDNEKIKNILNNRRIETSEKIKALSDENIFALKFKQIRSNADELAKALKTDCPATRNLDEAQNLINKAFGDKYEIKELVGVGTVAETYLVKDKSNKEFCIKMLKDGISAEKITKDKEAFVEIINNLKDKSADEKKFLIKNLENIAEGVKAEVDFTNEKNAAEALSKVTKNAKVVVPVDVKNNMYVMEKADGISLQNLLKYINNSEKFSKYADEVGDISKEDAKKLMEKYQDVIIEQFSKVDKSGKIIHGDIHPGNIFIDLKAMRNGDHNFFTLIDTGNTIKQSQKSALRFLNLSTYIKNADIENITKFVLEGATLPENMTKEQAYEKISKELGKIFFDDKTHIGVVTNDSLLGITDELMKKLNIIPSDTQGNLIKSKTAADQSMAEFQNTFIDSIEKSLEKKFMEMNITSEEDARNNMGKVLKECTAAVADMGISTAKYPIKKAIQERKNLIKLDLGEKVKIKQSKSTPKKNSEEYLTYVLKQNIPEKPKTT